MSVVFRFLKPSPDPAVAGPEIGRCTRFYMRDSKGDTYEYAPGTGVILNDEIQVHGWQEPVPTLSKMINSGTTVFTADVQREVANLQAVIAALVFQLGGSVTIQPAEIEHAVKDLILVNQHNKDFGYLMLGTEEKK